MGAKKRTFIYLAMLVGLVFIVVSFAMADAVIGGAVLAGKVFGWIKNGLLIGYSAAITFMVARKEIQCRNLMGKLKTYEKYWDESLIKKRVPEVFMKVKEAWAKRNQLIAKSHMSPALYKIHKMQTDAMKKRHEKNIIEKIKLGPSQVVNIIDHKGSSRDEVWVRMKGSMLSYMIDDRTGAVTEGSRLQAKKFTEVWKFTRSKKEWVLNDIIESAGLTEITAMKASSDAVKG